MQNVEEQILSYPHLPTEQQREVEAYVEAHPEWASLLRDVRALESLVRKDGAPSTDSFLTTYVVVQHIHPDEVTPELRAAFRRLEQKMEKDPSLRERAEAARQRLQEAEAELDPVAQFEALTGHSLEAEEEKHSVSADATSTTREQVRNKESASAIGTFIDDLLRLPLAVRWAGAAVALLLGTYVVLFAASKASQSTLDRLATINVSNQVVDNYTSSATRGAAPSQDTLSADQVYVDALAAVREARTSTFGLFPSYDAEKLDRAEQLLTQVLDRTPPGSFLALEARFYLGKVYLAQGQIESARASFKTVVQREGRMSVEARDILETLQEKYPVAGQKKTDQ